MTVRFGNTPDAYVTNPAGIPTAGLIVKLYLDAARTIPATGLTDPSGAVSDSTLPAQDGRVAGSTVTSRAGGVLAFGAVDGTTQLYYAQPDGSSGIIYAAGGVGADQTAVVTPFVRGLAPAYDPLIARAGACTALNRFLTGVKAGYGGAAGITIVTDSTGVDTSPGDGPAWPTLLVQWLAANYPQLTIRLRAWDQNNNVPLPPVRVQTGSGGLPYFDSGVNAAAYLYKPYGSAGLAAAGTMFGQTGDVDIRVPISSSTPTGRVNGYSLVSNFGPTTTQSDNGGQFRLNTDNTLTWKHGNATGNSANTWQSTAALPNSLFTGADFVVRVYERKNNGAGGADATFYYSTDDSATWTQLGAVVTLGAPVTSHGGNANWCWQLGTDQGGINQVITINGTPTGGTFTLSLNWSVLAQVTGPITWSATDATLAANIQAAIRALGGTAYSGAVVNTTATPGSFNVVFSGYPGLMTFGANNLTGGATIAIGQNNTVFPGHIYGVEIRRGLNGPVMGPTNVQDWQNDAGGTRYFGGPLLDVDNWAWAGHSIIDFTQQPYLDWSMTHRSQLLAILATSHNEGVTIGSAFTTFLDTWLTAARAKMPHAGFLMHTENPRLSPAGSIPQGGLRSGQAAVWAQRNGFTVIDTWAQFLRDPRWTGVADDTLMTSGGVHPKTLAHATIIAPLIERAIITGA